jgi:nucleotide-binding universal stress UspA family protein
VRCPRNVDGLSQVAIRRARQIEPSRSSTAGVAEAALTPAVDLARETGAKLLLLRAAEAPTRPTADPVEAQVVVMQEAQEYLAAAQDRVMAAGVADVEVSAWYGPPVEAIVEAARYRSADLIVMSSHGRSGVARLVMGSVTELVLRTTTVPILVIRPDGAPIDIRVVSAPTAKEVANV